MIKNSDPKIIFLHIPKTAGTSLRQIIEKEYPGKACIRLYHPTPYQPNVIKQIQAQLPTAQTLFGHVSFGIHDVLGIEGDYIAFLRNPIDRVLSLYNHNARQPGMHHYTTIQKGMSLLDWLQSEITVETNNHITRIIAGYGQPDMLDDNSILEQAIKNLEQNFCFVGLMEKFAESVNRLGNQLGWKHSYNIPDLKVHTPFQKIVARLRNQLGWKVSYTIPYLNVGSTQSIHQMDAKTQAALEKYNRLDILLYQFVGEKFLGSGEFYDSAK